MQARLRCLRLPRVGSILSLPYLVLLLLRRAEAWPRGAFSVAQVYDSHHLFQSVSVKSVDSSKRVVSRSVSE